MRTAVEGKCILDPGEPVLSIVFAPLRFRTRTTVQYETLVGGVKSICIAYPS